MAQTDRAQHDVHHQPARLHPPGTSRELGKSSTSANDTGRLASPSLLTLQRTAGNAAVGALLRGEPASNGPVVQRGIWDALGDAFDWRYNEKERDAYEDSMSDLKAFNKEVRKLERHKPSTGSGLFDVAYDPAAGQMTITVRCHFEFKDSVVERIVDPASDPRAPRMKDIIARWTEEEKKSWKARFLAQASNFWKDTHTFWCQRDWWEGLKVTTRAQFVDEPDTNPFKRHFELTVHKRGSIEKDEPRHTVGTVKSADWGEEMLDASSTGHPKEAHEAGHMLGLGDEYAGLSAGPLQHDKLVKAQFGKDLIQGKGDPEMGSVRARSDDGAPVRLAGRDPRRCTAGGRRSVTGRSSRNGGAAGTARAFPCRRSGP